MSKSDLRVQFPLWNIALYTILLLWAYSIVYAADLLFSDFDGIFTNTGTIQLDHYAVLSFSLGLISLLIFFTVYFLKMRHYNSNDSSGKMSLFTVLKPGEFLEDDELFSQITQSATKKVYVFYSQALPLVILLLFFPLDRYFYITAIFLVLILQNVIYYRHILKYVEND